MLLISLAFCFCVALSTLFKDYPLLDIGVELWYTKKKKDELEDPHRTPVLTADKRKKEQPR